MASREMEHEDTSTYVIIKPTYFRENVVFRRKGGVVTVDFNNVLQNIPAGTLGDIVAVGGIPVADRPISKQVVASAWVTGNAQVRLEIYADGHITGHNFGSAISGNNMYAVNTISYIVE